MDEGALWGWNDIILSCKDKFLKIVYDIIFAPLWFGLLLGINPAFLFFIIIYLFFICIIFGWYLGRNNDITS